MPEYKKPGWFNKNIFGNFISLAAKAGLSLSGAQVLSVKGRTSGEWRSAPVNPLTVDGVRYLVAPRGDTQWARNLRASGGGRLKLGRKTVEFKASEVVDAEKAPILKAYLAQWASVTVAHFGIPKEYTDADIARVVPRSPVFRVE